MYDVGGFNSFVSWTRMAYKRRTYVSRIHDALMRCTRYYKGLSFRK